MPKPLDTSHMRWADFFEYDETSPTFLRWAVDLYNSRGVLTAYARIGRVAGKKNGERATVLLHGKRYKVHRIIWEMFNGPIPTGFIVDHEDGVHSNNQKDNLRAVTQTVNTRNAMKRLDNSSGVTGVSRSDNGRGTEYWTASWSDGSKQIHKRFSIKKLGEQAAFEAAVSHRAACVSELNAQGAGYTERHGT